MTERPILFSAPMVRAILAGTKTQTRRALRWQPDMSPGEPPFDYQEGPGWPGRCPYGEPGDVLWVRETHALVRAPDFTSVIYRADGAEHPCDDALGIDPEPCDRMSPAAAKRWRWRPSIHMPRRACRLRLLVTDVRVRRVQSISEEDARAEGVRPPEHQTARGAFADLWDSINAKRGFGWREDPWVWVVSFERVGGEA